MDNTTEQRTDDREQQILNSMRGIIDPDLGKDIVSLGFIRDLAISDQGEVTFAVALTTPACPVKDQFKAACEAAVSALPWVTAVHVTMTAQKRPNPMEARGDGLAKVAPLLAVSSCKGGVGKSTVAVNLAYTLARSGAKVGLFDADVYGPSLPTMVAPEAAGLYQEDGLIVPLAVEGVKLMSFGFIPQEAGGAGDQPAIMRGPMVTQVINQLLTGTNWGELDYLVIDFPPGTGDIQLTLTQLVPLTASVIVTTPQQLSFVDVAKGIRMFDKLKVPVVAVVENMSWFECDGCGKRHRLFGEGARQRLTDQYGYTNTFEFPVVPELSWQGDHGVPLVVAAPASAVAARFQELAGSVVREVSKIVHGGVRKPKVLFDAASGIALEYPDGREVSLNAAEVRRACRCALCVDETSGAPLLDPASVPEDIYPTLIKPLGNYAVAIHWSDGHTSSIYPYDKLEELASTTG